MTTPDLLSAISMPFSLVLHGVSGSNLLQLAAGMRTSGGHDRHIDIPAGTSVVRLSWEGEEAVSLWQNKGGSWRQVGESIPTGGPGKTRSISVDVSSPSASQLRILIPSLPGSVTLNNSYTAGISIYPTPTP